VAIYWKATAIMPRFKDFWQPGRQTRIAEETREAESPRAHFGYRQVPENEKVHWVRRHFNTVAARYDLMNTLLSFGIHYLWKRVAVRALNLEEGAQVLDVCGGTGDLALMAAAKIGSAGRVTLYDINRSMIEAGLAKIEASDAGRRIHFIQGDAEHICFGDNCFDAAMVGFGIRNVTHMQQGFGEMYRVLKPGGQVMCLEFSKPTHTVFRWLYDWYSFQIMPFLGDLIVGSRNAYLHLPESIRLFPSPDELADMLATLGFKQVHYQRLTNGIAVIHTAVKP
jgi:demethylmenaquinone methyltransferase/2-methoxy-6-polyprenyl-1,4-benzoquinol methylase